MEKAVIGIDHIGLAGRDMDRFLSAYRRLGFHVTEPQPLMARRGGDLVPLGQTSAHMVFRDNYIELTAVPDPDTGNHLEPNLERYEGVHIVALRSAGASLARSAIAAGGVTVGDLQQASREIKYGSGGTAEFNWFALPPSDAPGGYFCVVEHVTPGLVFQDEVTGHPNGAQSLVEVTVCAGDVDGVSALYRRFLATPNIPAGHGQTFDFGEARIVVTDPAGLASRYPGAEPPALPSLAGFTIAAADLQHVRALLQEAGVAVRDGERGLWVAAEDAGGAVVEFRGPD